MDIFHRFALTFCAACLLVVTSLSPSLLCAQDSFAQDSAQNELEFPYTAIVRSNETEIYSGPGKMHYATMRTSQGKTVEVYRHDPGGWCAIRPPAESFSLIPAEAVKIVGPKVGQIREDGTQAWVGTSLGPVDHPLWQLKLKRGETVAVLGELSWPNPEGHSTIWYQVRPPAGEFRWIRIADLQLPPTINPRQLSKDSLSSDSMNNASTIDQPADDIDRNVRQVNLQTSIDSRNRFSDGVSFADEVGMNSPRSDSGWKRASRPVPKTASKHTERSSEAGDFSTDSNYSNSRRGSSRNDGYVGAFANPGSSSFGSGSSVSSERFASRDSMSSQLRSLNAVPRSDVSPRSPQNSSNNFNVSDRLATLELELSHEMLKQPEKWELVNLKSKVEGIVDSTREPTERLDAQKLLDKINQCQQLHNGYASAGTLAQPGLGRSLSGGVSSDIGVASTYDAYGWLSELVQGGGSLNPTYVLQDDNGRITHHVTGGPGLNLNRYLKSKVGVFGRRGYNSRLQVSHVTVERVVVVKTR